ncbi:MAG TPA: flagellar biosynthetic protein FliR [Tepidisphaeraceae bacterium]|jgi:flagellar biosynthetic protein FliR
MSLEQFQSLLPTFLLALVRVTGVVLFAPIIGSRMLPARVKIIFSIALTVGLLPTITVPAGFSASMWMLAPALACELGFGIVMGMAANFAFMAAQWAGEMAGQQMGFTLSGVMDPQTGSQGSVLGDFYLLLAIVVFLLINGHHALVRSLRLSFDAVPLLGVTLDRNLLNVMVAMLQSATLLALQLAAPLLVTMLIVDVALGVTARVVPQMNVLAMGLSVRSAIGLVVLLVITAITATSLGTAMTNWMKLLGLLWKGTAGA